MPFQIGNQLYKLRKPNPVMGEAHHNWKENVSYKSLHEWIRKWLPKPEVCKCGNRPPREVSNTSGKYLRDLNDWEWLCTSCHRLKDFAKLRKERGYAKSVY